jgi:platelet-activating factor acetylhydrolase IB subunit alpha
VISLAISDKHFNKIIELESKVAQLQTELESAPSRKSNPSSQQIIPKSPEKFTLSGHRGPITSIRFHAFFSIIATSSEDATIKLWDYETGEFERSLKGHTKSVQCISFNDMKNDASLLASCSADLSIKIWDANADYKCIKTCMGHDHSISSVHFIYPGDFIVSASRDKTIKIWEVSSGYAGYTLYSLFFKLIFANFLDIV